MTKDAEGAREAGPGRDQLEVAFNVFMQKAAELEASHATLQAKVQQLTDELAVKVREVEQLRDHLANVLESVADAVVAVDQHGRVTSFNRAAEELFGRPEEKCCGRSLEEVGQMAAPLAELVGQLLVGGERRRSEERSVCRADGSEAVLLLSVAPLRDAQGRPAGAVASAQDITQLRELERALARKERLAALGNGRGAGPRDQESPGRNSAVRGGSGAIDLPDRGGTRSSGQALQGCLGAQQAG
jgi:PAS domain S-box-containing protein